MEAIQRKRRVDYSLLVSHLQLQRTREANELLKEVIPKLIEYLRVTMRAEETAAYESVHQAYLAVHERIMDDKIRDHKSILGYMMQASRNAFLNLKANEKRYRHQLLSDNDIAEPALQVEELIDEERMEILQICINELDEYSQEFINYYIDNPGVGSKQVADYFDISEANARTKKSRNIVILSDMYKQKLRIVSAA